MSELIGVVQQIVQNTVKAMRLADKETGTVVSLSPLAIQTDGTMSPIPEKALLLTDAVKARTAPVQGGEGGMVTIHEGLAAGDRVLMLRVQRGQQYIVLSKIP
ncbi:MAG: DUF2577 domain-containing protein [Lachnospiraceae bacterium]|nr:DUF2577 domain-containing protein [Lachnospiraceae bacterium]